MDALLLFKRNVALHFEGVAECAICYAILSADKALPSKKCNTCRHKFHSSCLFKVSATCLTSLLKFTSGSDLQTLVAVPSAEVSLLHIKLMMVVLPSSTYFISISYVISIPPQEAYICAFGGEEFLPRCFLHQSRSLCSQVARTMACYTFQAHFVSYRNFLCNLTLK